MRYLLDTCVISDFVKGDTNTLSTIKRHAPTDLAISSITLMEIEYGLALNPAKAARIKPVLTDFLRVVPILPFTSETAHHTAQLREGLKRKGTPIGAYDVLIAATALHHRCIMVTSNIGEFKRVAVELENWREVDVSV